jgi:hypothetical protein
LLIGAALLRIVERCCGSSSAVADRRALLRIVERCCGVVERCRCSVGVVVERLLRIVERCR